MEEPQRREDGQEGYSPVAELVSLCMAITLQATAFPKPPLEKQLLVVRTRSFVSQWEPALGGRNTARNISERAERVTILKTHC